MKLYDLLKDVEYTVVRGGNPDIKDLIYDSRKVSDGTAFVALKGAAADGHKYAASAIEKGAAALIVSDDIDSRIPDGVAVVKTADTRLALALMSRTFFGYPERELKTVAITGTKGKTTTTAMIAQIFELAGIRTGTIGTDVGVFTNFSNDHIGGVEHKDMAEYLYCKSLLFRQCKNAAANIDDPSWEKITADFKGDILTYGFSENAKLRAKNDRLLSEGGFIGVHFETEGLKTLSPDVGVPGKFNAYNALAAISAVSFFDIDDKAILDGLKIAHVKGRVEPVKVPGNYSLLIDYAHNALSMENVLTTLRQYNPNRLITMFGAGGNRPKVRRFEMGETSGRLSDLSVITEDNSRFEDVMDIIADIEVGLHKTDGKYVVVPKRKEAIRYCMLNAQDGDIIVLAGKGHEDYQEIKGVKYHMDERELIAEIIEEEGL